MAGSGGIGGRGSSWPSGLRCRMGTGEGLEGLEGLVGGGGGGTAGEGAPAAGAAGGSGFLRAPSSERVRAGSAKTPPRRASKRRGEERFRSRDRVARGLMRGGVARRSRAGRAGVLPEDGVDVVTRDPSGCVLTNCQQGRKRCAVKITVAQRVRLSGYDARDGCRSHQQGDQKAGE